MPFQPLFNPVWYLQQNLDVAQAVEQGLTNAWQHFESHGQFEGRSPTPLFSTDFYLSQNPDVAQAVALGQVSAWQHFVSYGQIEDRAPLKLFNVDFYLEQNPDVAQAVREGNISAVEHFLLYGLNESRSVAPSINLQAYLEANPDVAEAVQNGLTSALDHLLQFGVQEQRDLGNGVSLSLFENDPVFLAALANGDAGDALARVDAVAPFMPEFLAPAGWKPAADTPIPMDFLPPAGSDLKLVVPEGVEIPADVALPEVFTPVEQGGDGAGEGGNSSGGSSGGGSGNVAPLPEPVMFTPQPATKEGSSDASTAIALDEGFMVVADDEGAILRVYDRKGGEAVAEWSIADAAKLQDSDLGKDEIDLEAGTRIGDTLYFTGSHSNSRAGGEADAREYLFAVKVEGTGADTEFTLGDIQKDLESLLVSWDQGNGHNKGTDYFGFAAASANGVVPEQVGGFSIEGMAASPDATELWLGFRAPQVDTQVREKALIVPVKLDGVFDAAPVFGDPIELALGGRGIRSIEKAQDNSGYLIIAGPASPSSEHTSHDFRLYSWSGEVGAEGQAAGLKELDVLDHNGRAVSLDSLLKDTGGSFETLVEVSSIKPGTAVQLLQDNGDTIWPGQTKVSKDLDEADQQFMGNWIRLGEEAANTAPELKGGNIVGMQDIVIGNKAGLVLHFDEAVKWGEGSIVLKEAGDEGVVVETFDAASTRATFTYNTLTLDPAADLAGGDYVLEFHGSAVQNLSGQAAKPISTLGFAVTEPEPYTLMITEVNSNHKPEDFFEIYNYGMEDISLAGWKWLDGGADTGWFAEDVVVKAGGVLVVVAGAESDAIEPLKTQWNLSEAVTVVAMGGGGLGGSGDAVFLYDGFENLVAGFNYGTVSLTALDGTVIEPVSANGGQHIGEVFSAAKDVSAVWDGVSSYQAPNYIAATELHGAPKGTPGVAVPRLETLLITEVNSNASGGDFFEIYNYGTEDIDLSGWKWLDDTAELEDGDFGVFADGTTVKAGGLLLVAAGTESVDKLSAAWELAGDVDVVAVGGSGLGGGDAVRIYNEEMKLVTALNYGTSAIRSLDDTVVAPIYGSKGGHAGLAAGGVNKEASLVWDGVSVDIPVYVSAESLEGQPLGTPGTYGMPGDDAGDTSDMTPPTAQLSTLLITEVNSKHTSDIDFFELYNHGPEAIDLSGWGWTDSDKAKHGKFADGTIIGAGEVLVVVGAENTLADFLTTWSLEADSARYIEVGGPGLGKGDGVILYDGAQNTMAWFNYSGSDITGLDEMVLASVAGTDNKHAGAFVGASDEAASAIWDGVSPYEAPLYVGADIVLDGLMGSPGLILIG